MSKSAKVFDPFPKYKPAGSNPIITNDSAKLCVTGSIGDNEKIKETPKHMKKYRNSYKMQTGKKILHPGFYDDDMPDKDFVYGKKTLDSAHVNDIFKDKNQGILELVNEIKENKYASKSREPLGKPMVRNYKFPNEVNEEFKFGVPTKWDEFNAKEVVLPTDLPIKETEENRKLYLKSHGMTNPGEQKNRNYDWKFDPNQHTFGKAENKIFNEARLVLKPDNTEDNFPQTKVVQKNLADYKNFVENSLGKTKNLGQTSKHISKDHAFGFKKNTNEWSVGQCIRGEATLKENFPENDLGKTTRFGFKNEPKKGDEDRIFGTPTIRTDIIKKGLKSISDPNNYGDELPAINLLLPQNYAELGLTEEDFLKLREKKEIREIFNSIGISYKMGKFEAVFKRALEIQNSNSNFVSVKAFSYAAFEMNDIE